MTRQTENITDQISQLLREYRIPSAAIGILRDGTISDFAAGLRNLSTGEPAATDTIYQCGSMTKTWTALAFMQLVQLCGCPHRSTYAEPATMPMLFSALLIRAMEAGQWLA